VVSLRFVKGRFRAEPWGSKDAAEAGAGSIAGRVSRRGGRIGTEEMIWIRCNDGDSSSSETEGLLGNQRARAGKEPEGAEDAVQATGYIRRLSTIDCRPSTRVDDARARLWLWLLRRQGRPCRGSSHWLGRDATPNQQHDTLVGRAGYR
jgi:hypothetical protein